MECQLLEVSVVLWVLGFNASGSDPNGYQGLLEVWQK